LRQILVLKFLINSKRNKADGKFDITLKMFPCVTKLLPGQSFELYRLGIQILKDQVLKNGVVWDPDFIMTDYEQAAIKAFKYHFPKAQFLGCFFHYAQYLWQKFCEISLKVEYKNEDPKIWF
jgi:hypothetical protein